MQHSKPIPSARAFQTVLAFALAGVGLSGCAIRNVGPALKNGPAEVQNFPSAIDQSLSQDYHIGAFDTLDVAVFQEPDLTTKGIQVDASGRIRLPLVGEVNAAGKTAMELSHDLEALYGARYLVRPQITVNVANATSQKVVIQGEVKSPGVYPIRGTATLLEAFSLAGGETQVSALNQVVVFRTVNGKRMGAIFDVEAIRRGEAADPAIYGNDVVVAGFSNARGLYRDLLTAIPLLNTFVILTRN